jgi:hypothetical protein
LPTHCSGHGLRRVHVGEEPGRVVFDSLDGEAVALVLSRRGVLQTCDEAILSTLNAAYALSNIGARVYLDRVGECDAWRTRLACDSFMDMGGSACRGRVIAAEPSQSDIVADNVVFAVQAKLAETLSACKTAGQGVVSVHDLFRGRSNLECGGVFRRSLDTSRSWISSLSSGGSRSCY